MILLSLPKRSGNNKSRASIDVISCDAWGSTYSTTWLPNWKQDTKSPCPWQIFLFQFNRWWKPIYWSYWWRSESDSGQSSEVTASRMSYSLTWRTRPGWSWRSQTLEDTMFFNVSNNGKRRSSLTQTLKPTVESQYSKGHNIVKLNQLPFPRISPVLNLLCIDVWSWWNLW